MEMLPTHPPHSHQNAMERATKRAAERVNQHREDGEEAIKHTSKVVPIDAGKNGESVQVASESKSQLERKAFVRDGKKRGSSSHKKRASRRS